MTIRAPTWIPAEASEAAEVRHYLIVARNRVHADAPMASIGPSLSVVSRTRAEPWLTATSTHWLCPPVL
jgi:hypothetical protein